MGHRGNVAFLWFFPGDFCSFVNGVRRDIDAVKKAIELDYNNGLAEGSVNRLKW